MKVKDLKEYLNTFDENGAFAVVVVDTKKRIVHKQKAFNLISDMAALILEVDGTEPMDEIFERVSEDGGSV